MKMYSQFYELQSVRDLREKPINYIGITELLSTQTNNQKALGDNFIINLNYNNITLY